MNFAIITAAGEGKRFSGKIPKLLLPVLNKPVLYYSVAAFYDHPKINKIIIIVNKRIKRDVEKMLKDNFPGNSKDIEINLGGKTRPESVLEGIKFIEKNYQIKPSDLLIIHNGANPLVTYREIEDCIKTAKNKGACIAAHSIKDTLKEIQKNKIIKTHKRENFVGAQTPQIFKYDIFRKALKKAGKNYFDMTDEASLVEKAGFHVSHISASENNYKITTTSDYERVKHILGDVPEDYIFGIGQDSHAFSDIKGLILGGLKLEKENKLEANSDGDVLLHALCNAILQATGESSLGAFADDLCKIKKIRDSRKYLKTALEKARKKGYILNHLGVMIECRKPKIDEISQKLKYNLSLLTGLPLNRIGITATSGEQLTSFGEGKGIQCFCVASLKSEK